MDRARKARGVVRSSVTRIYGLITTELANEAPDMNAVVGNLHLLQKKFEELESWDSQIFNLMLDIEDNLDEFERETTIVDEYASKFQKLKCEIDSLLKTREAETNSAGGDSTNVSSVADMHVMMAAGQQVKRKIRLPEIEFKKFSGDLKDWLYFWSMFKKIDADREIADEDKFQYLIQNTLEGSRAREFINSFPPTGENYKKAIEGLKARFGQEDMLVEVYVRELLVLVLKNALNSDGQVTLCSLYDKLESQLRALESLGVTSDKYAAMLYPLVESCLPEDLLRAWQRSPILTGDADDAAVAPKNRLAKLMKFIKTEVQNEERINLATAGFGLSATPAKPKKKSTASFTEKNIPTAASLANFHKDVKPTGCIFCERQHASVDCIKAQKMTMVEKRKCITDKKACFLCLKVGHLSRRCRMFLNCILCHGKHLPLMCPKLESNQEAGEGVKNEEACKKTETLANHAKSPHVLLQTLVVKLENKQKSRYVRAIVDTGSQYSYILEKTAADMDYKKNGEERFVQSLFGGAQSVEQVHNQYKINVSSLDGKYKCNFDVFDQHSIVGAVSHIRKGPWTNELLQNKINISDTGEVSGSIELLIGADVAGKLMTGSRHVLKCGLVAIETRLGWTLMGKVPGEKSESTTTMTVIAMFTQEAKITELWDLDVLGIRDPVETKTRLQKEQEATEHFLKTVTVNSEGRYEICLPWLEERPQLPTNRDLAEKRLQVTTKKLKNENYFCGYDHVLNNWEKEGIIEPAVDSSNEEPVHYLPHRHVVKENSTTRIRPVFDASANLKGYPSLNQCVEKGQNLLELIPSVLLRFRKNKIGVIADIEKAFLQISVCKEDRNFLRFLWWNDDKQTHLKIYRHARVVFGMSCSPWLLASVINYHLQKVLEEASSDNGETFFSRETVLKLMNSFYVDNCVLSVNNKQELDNFICESRNVMAGARMNLRGWEHSVISNASELTNEMSMVLGLKWNRKTDTLEINLDNLNNDFNSITKRTILSVANKIFDPIGFLCPITLGPKLFLQQAWSAQIGWDSEVPEEIKDQFLKWAAELKFLEAIKIPRWLVSGPSNPESWSIHTFCDASKLAYAAAVFLRAETLSGVEVQLIQARSRVAPMKELTIPRLELLAATVGARLTTEVLKSLKRDDICCTMWSDSTTVLTWIQQEEQWATYVGNRVREIRNLTDPKSWRHIAGKCNPADLPSRGCNVKQLVESRWWLGPPWLSCAPTEWPTSKFTYDKKEVEKEKKKTAATVMTSIANNVDEDNWLYCRFSNYDRILQLVAWVWRFISNCRKPRQEREVGAITVEEIKHAEITVMKIIQRPMRENGRFSSLCTYEDSNGIIRLKTKIVNRVDSNNFRRPIILSSTHPVVKSLILNKHEKINHAGTHLLLNALREDFWILRGRKSIRGILKTCVRCRRHESHHFEAEAGPLPVDRVRNAMVFEIIGVDFAGPLFLKDNKKCWICLFTCAIYRAVHLELVMSLSTEAFILALRRFIARRGRPKIIFSDNGTNFVGTKNLLAKVDWDRIRKYATIQRIEWRFNPPNAAWWGGWWERLIRLLKNLLKRMLGKTCLWYEEMASLLCECEAIMNSRPITYLAEGDADFLPLTPSMFLHEIEENGVPDLDAIDTASLNKRIRYRQKLRNDLQQRFRTEYLGQLIQRIGNRGKTRKVEEGEIVLIGSDNQKRIDWPLGRVLEIIPGSDGIGRVVRLRTAKGEVVRPIQKIYPLEITPREEEVFQEKIRSEKIETARPPVRTHSGREVKTPKRFMN